MPTDDRHDRLKETQLITFNLSLDSILPLTTEHTPGRFVLPTLLNPLVRSITGGCIVSGAKHERLSLMRHHKFDDFVSVFPQSTLGARSVCCMRYHPLLSFLDPSPVDTNIHFSSTLLPFRSQSPLCRYSELVKEARNRYSSFQETKKTTMSAPVVILPQFDNMSLFRTHSDTYRHGGSNQQTTFPRGTQCRDLYPLPLTLASGASGAQGPRRSSKGAASLLELATIVRRIGKLCIHSMTLYSRMQHLAINVQCPRHDTLPASNHSTKLSETHIAHQNHPACKASTPTVRDRSKGALPPQLSRNPIQPTNELHQDSPDCPAPQFWRDAACPHLKLYLAQAPEGCHRIRMLRQENHAMYPTVTPPTNYSHFSHFQLFQPPKTFDPSMPSLNFQRVPTCPKSHRSHRLIGTIFPSLSFHVPGLHLRSCITVSHVGNFSDRQTPGCAQRQRRSGDIFFLEALTTLTLGERS
ncbi:uncharacterized protein BDR25DRAFT_358750 [Lindgomyces ingoldianus]|uniref:Uncharacterized protein n=1 Tax=Lindgomyces ingoldianus TaxID=673940 RepID=A0ACB6QK08_9PLEO|nr:uncharacterized protein BDR25DRAFT_358750 [Lindgomyces ingoldianus]KAF2467207.1 hypothetical protein BDR25DRAFT_358750 [Lindgomyces ingoldianus]